MKFETSGELFTKLLRVSLAASPAGRPDAAPTARPGEEWSDISKEIRLSDAGLLARLAIYFDEQRNFRDLAFLLSAELAAVAGNQESTGALVARIVRHAADIPLWLTFYAMATKPAKRPARPVRNHLAVLFNRLDEFQYSRYNRETQLALREALRLLRPKAADAGRKRLFADILRDRLPVRTSWEQEWHTLYRQYYDSPDQRQVALRDKWKEGISSFRIGYAALLNNLRPMLCAGVSGKVLKLAAGYLGNAAAVSRSGTSSLHILQVYRSLRHIEQGGTGMLTEALEQAILHSTWARSEFGKQGISVIAMDVSNSMKRPVDGSANVGAHRFDIGPLLALLWKSRGSRVLAGIIGNTWRPVGLPVRPVLMTVDEFRAHEGEAGYGINAWLVLRDLLQKKQVVDRVLIFTDYRLWDNRHFNQPAGADLGRCWRQYKELVAPAARLYLFDLAGYGSKPLECLDDDVFLFAGWKERIIDILDAIEAGSERHERVPEM